MIAPLAKLEESVRAAIKSEKDLAREAEAAARDKARADKEAADARKKTLDGRVEAAKEAAEEERAAAEATAAFEASAAGKAHAAWKREHPKKAKSFGEFIDHRKDKAFGSIGDQLTKSFPALDKFKDKVGADSTVLGKTFVGSSTAAVAAIAGITAALFGFANAGVSLAGITLAKALEPVPIGIALGLLIGKQVGIFGATYAAVKSGICRPLEGATWMQIWGVSILGGIGFTMSLFIGMLAFDDPAYAAAIRIGVLAGSLLSAMAGFAVLRLASART